MPYFIHSCPKWPLNSLFLFIIYRIFLQDSIDTPIHISMFNHQCSQEHYQYFHSLSSTSVHLNTMRQFIYIYMNDHHDLLLFLVSRLIHHILEYIFVINLSIQNYLGKHIIDDLQKVLKHIQYFHTGILSIF